MTTTRPGCCCCQFLGDIRGFASCGPLRGLFSTIGDTARSPRLFISPGSCGSPDHAGVPFNLLSQKAIQIPHTKKGTDKLAVAYLDRLAAGMNGVVVAIY
jgi:hypothetical protein